MHETPKIFALCGQPKSGKTTLARILEKRLDYQIIDDALPIRSIAAEYFGLSLIDVVTQDGKSKQFEFMGRQWTVRQILGEIGNALEDKFGANVFPELAYRRICRMMKRKSIEHFVVPSVRRDQGIFWKSKGAIVVEIYNPNVPVSTFEFDQYNKSVVDIRLVNDFDLRGMLHVDKEHSRLYDRFVKQVQKKLIEEIRSGVSHGGFVQNVPEHMPQTLSCDESVL